MSLHLQVFCLSGLFSSVVSRAFPPMPPARCRRKREAVQATRRSAVVAAGYKNKPLDATGEVGTGGGCGELTKTLADPLATARLQHEAAAAAFADDPRLALARARGGDYA